MSDTERLHSWIARASFPEERLRCRAFAAADEQDAVVVEDRCASWEAVFAPGDSAAASAEELAALKTALLRARGLTEAEWRDGLRDYVVRAPQYLPAWAATFIELQHRWHAAPCAPAAATAPPGKPHLLLTAVWAECSRAWTQARRDELRAAGIILTDAAVDDLLEYLTLRLATPVFAVLSAWPGARAGDGDNGNGDRWRFLRAFAFWENAFDRQPILAHVIGHLTHLWRTSTAEMLMRFKTDAPRLRDAGVLRAAGGDSGGAITVSRLRCGLGDPHRGGRSVAIIETDCGDVVYKPKDLAGTRAAGRLLRELFDAQPAHGKFVPLAPEFLRRRGYGWERRVVARECDSTAEVETFYRRLGAWLFLLQLLNGNDFWYDNLIACGDMPTFIDYETVVGNSVARHFFGSEKHERGAPVDEHVEMFYQMQLIGILPLLMPGAVDASLADGIDISVVTKPGKQSIPFPKDNGTVGGFHDDFEASDYAPFYRGQFQDMNDYLEHFIDGYRRMAALLESTAGRAALQRFRRRIKRARFRHIVIDTWSCYALLRAVFSGCRTDGVRAAILLDGVCVRFCRYPRRVVEGLRRDAWRNDVPLFEMQSDSLKLFNTADDATQADFFSDTALAKIIRNRVYLRQEIDRQARHIKALFSTRPDHPRRRWRPAGGDSTATAAAKVAKDSTATAAAKVAKQELLELAQQTGAQLAADLNRVDALRGYLAIGRAQLNNIRALQPLPTDYHGAAGAVVFLAQLRHYRGVDVAAIAEIDAALARCGRYLLDDAAPRMLPFDARGMAEGGGALSNCGGKLTALCSLAQTQTELDFDATQTIARMMNQHLDNLTAGKTLCADARHGVSGLLCRFPDLARLFAADTVAAWLAHILSAVESNALQLSPPQTDAYRKYADALSPAHDMKNLDHMMRTHWPKLITHAGYRKLQRFIADHGAVKSASTVDTPSPQPLRDLRCETLLDRAYHFLSAGRDGDGELRAQFQRHLAELIAHRRISGRWFPDQWADDSFLPGAIHGQADIGLLLLSASRGENLNPFRMPAPAAAGDHATQHRPNGD